jgi:hypothetical protein
LDSAWNHEKREGNSVINDVKYHWQQPSIAKAGWLIEKTQSFHRLCDKIETNVAVEKTEWGYKTKIVSNCRAGTQLSIQSQPWILCRIWKITQTSLILLFNHLIYFLLSELIV